MTVKEAIMSYPGMVDISELTIDRIISDRSVNGAVVYTSKSKKEVELSVADCLFSQIVNPDFSEADLSIKYSRTAMITQAKILYKRHGDTEKLKEIASFNQRPRIISRQW